MSEKQETNGQTTEELDVVDVMLGGASHSPAAEAIVPDPTPEDRPAPEGDVSDSAEPAKDSAPVPQESALQEEVKTLQKRFHDTQRAMHEAKTENANLRKELESLKTQRAAEEDWFSESDAARVEALETELQESDKNLEELETEQSDIEERAAIAIWDAAAAQVQAEHTDFDEVVYEKFVPLLDEQSGNAQVRQMWLQQTDKSPAAAYAFAKKVEDLLLMQNDPEAYRAKIRSEIEREQNINNEETNTVTGKEGLDLLNSADSGYVIEDRQTGDVFDFLS